MFMLFFFFWRNRPARARAASFVRFREVFGSYLVARTPEDERSTRRTDLYLTSHIPHKRQTSMPPAGRFLYSLFLLCTSSVLVSVSWLFCILPFCRYFPTHKTNIYAPGGNRTHNPSKRSSADPRLRLLGLWDRLVPISDRLWSSFRKIFTPQHWKLPFSYSDILKIRIFQCGRVWNCDFAVSLKPPVFSDSWHATCSVLYSPHCALREEMKYDG